MRKKLLALLTLAVLVVVFSVSAIRLHGSADTVKQPTLDWGATARSGPYPPAPGVRNFQVDAPDGNIPSYNDLESLQYHHHTRVAVDKTGRIWEAYSGAQREEGESGMITEIKSSPDGVAWSQPAVMMPPASAFDGDQNAGRRISYPRSFVTYRGQLYLVSAIDQSNGHGCCTNEQGEALVAVALREDGTIGVPFRVSASAYTPLHGYPGYAYDPILGPPIFKLADNFGTWGGSAPGQPPSAWTGYGTAADGSIMVEPNTAALTPHELFRLWRDEGKTGQFVLYWSISKDDGATWSPALPANIPNSPSETAVLKLADGNIAVVGNARDQSTTVDARDPLFLAVFDGKTGAMRSVYSVRQGLTAPAHNSGTVCGPAAKPCGAAYPGLYEHNHTLYISYSAYKQEIWLATIPSGKL